MYQYNYRNYEKVSASYQKVKTSMEKRIHLEIS